MLEIYDNDGNLHHLDLSESGIEEAYDDGLEGDIDSYMANVDEGSLLSWLKGDNEDGTVYSD